MAGAVGLGDRVFTRPKRASWARRQLTLVKKKPVGAFALFLILALLFIAIFSPLISPFDPNELRPRERLHAPSTTYWLGTDQVGRDVLSRLMWGARISIYVGILAVGIGIGAGSVIGLVSGYFGGKVDLIIQRVVDTMMAFPLLIFALVLVTVLGPGITNMMIAIGVAVAPGDSRVIRSAVLAIKENTYVEAGRAVGITNTRMILKYILPNVMAPIIVLASLLVAAAIITEASLSFLGLGVQPPTPSWGNMLSAEGRRYMELAPWLAIAPGFCIMITVLAYNLFGDTLRDILDPRLRGT
ncbi:MAG: ABC transporter permease [Dehalococcoidia bacterium]|nr:ABC transporter permease [Dehalococcoidia bacterium]